MSFYFDPTNVDISNLLPAGLYTAMITDLKDVDSKAGGKYLNLELTITNNDQLGGRKIYDRINYKCSNEKAMEIANRTLTTIIMAKFGEKKIIEDESELLHSLVEILVDQKHDDFKNDKINVIKYYKVPAKKG